MMIVPMLILACGVTAHAADDAATEMMSITTETPFIQPLFGQSMWTLENSADIEASLAFGAIMGFEKTKRVKNAEDILHHNANGLYVMFHTAGEDKPETFAVSSWRFGFTAEDSYGYAFNETDNTGFYLSSAKAPLSWYSVSIDGEGNESLAGYSQLNRFPDGLRFGEAATASIGVRVSDPVTVTAGFEWALVYERHIFWYWAGSAVIEGVADGLASWFVREVGVSSPAALPIMHFILRNGVAMGFKALRQNEMNWPITSAAPLNVITYSLGVNVHF